MIWIFSYFLGEKIFIDYENARLSSEQECFFEIIPWNVYSKSDYINPLAGRSIISLFDCNDIRFFVSLQFQNDA